MLLEKAHTGSKMIELQNGYVEIIQPETEVNRTFDPAFYQFLAKLLVEDKQMQIKNESRPSKD